MFQVDLKLGGLMLDLTELKQNVKLFRESFKYDFALESCNSFLLKVLMFTKDATCNGFAENIKLKAVKEAFDYGGILKFKDPDNFQVTRYQELLLKAIDEMEKYFNE
jgi:hypothetical protein